MKETYWFSLKEKLRKEADKLILESEKEFEKYCDTHDSISRTISAHIDEIVNHIEEALYAIEYFTELQ